ncbi:NADH-quinone oxidoreductase subunit J [Anaerocolumna sedimenticola]|uniref:NADH-quinone oxidoreductase subunit J n=1 Tax=Anaerocolumna sedimenticola TaxID=2696063 RepID=A0A6P1TNF8_9FIRM|nr:4Fe-4S dicluster domain-containing protein [Anaerocolumna sedimenticola]QHQ61857.1 NADH-quinone oxidoreductase subunit J [Anaerocolumna sedimenticola]
MDIKELTSRLRENGIVGAGGAGFPTYAKIDKKADTIILNCAECEPLLKVHRQLLQKYAYEIMSALDMIAVSVEASEVIISVKEAYTKTVEAIRANMETFPKIKLKLLKEVYPMGDEVVLIYETTGKKVPPGSIPIEVGVAVFNVETVFNVYKAVIKNEPVYMKYLTVAGEVNTPITIKAPIGMPVEAAVELAGGSKIKDYVYIMGGPMTGSIVEGYDTVKKTTNAILVLPSDHTVVHKKVGKSSIDMKRAMASCCQCEMCTDLCPRHLLGHPITPHMFMRAATSGVTKDLAPFLDTMFCCSCGICEMFACPQDLSPRKLITEYKAGLRNKGIPIPKGIPSKDTDPMREYRKVPMERLTARLGLVEYDVDAPLDEKDIAAGQVKISLSQHIGAKALAVVKKNDLVNRGDIIAKAEDGKLSASVHASISGEIIEVNDRFVIIKSISD